MTLDKEWDLKKISVSRSGHLYIIEGRCSAEHYTAVENQNSVSVHFTSEQILPFGFAEQYSRPLLSHND